jgi:hypothetical protein
LGAHAIRNCDQSRGPDPPFAAIRRALECEGKLGDHQRNVGIVVCAARERTGLLRYKGGPASFTSSLRWQLRNTPVDLVEIIPPAVDTDLQAPGLHKFGVNVDEFADHVFAELEAGKIETAYGTAVTASVSPPQRLAGIFQEMNERFSS